MTTRTRLIHLVCTAVLLTGCSAVNQLTATDAPATTLKVAVGQSVPITQGDDSAATIVVDKFEYAAHFGPTEYGDDPGPGNVFYNAHVKYAGTKGSFFYSSGTWQAYAGSAVAGDAYVGYAPGEALGTGSLPAGRTAEGWIHWKGPKNAGTVTISYKGLFSSTLPVFEVTVKCCA